MDINNKYNLGGTVWFFDDLYNPGIIQGKINAIIVIKRIDSPLGYKLKYVISLPNTNDDEYNKRHLDECQLFNTPEECSSSIDSDRVEDRRWQYD